MKYKDLIKGNSYYAESPGYYKWILQYGVGHIYMSASGRNGFDRVQKTSDHFESGNLVFRDALPDEIEWIEQCKAEGKFVEKNINYQIY